MEQTSTPLPENKTLLTWQAPVHPNHDRTKRWYVIAGGVVLAIIAYAILTGAWSFAVVMVLCAGVYFLVRDHKHGDETIVISGQGITIRSQFLRWEDIRGYWVLETPAYTELHITPKEKRTHDMKIQTGQTPPGDIKNVLNSFVPELADAHESWVDFLIRICKL